MAIRTGRYRKSFFSQEELAHHLPAIKQILGVNEELFIQKKLSEIDFVAKCLIELRQLKPDKWYSGKKMLHQDWLGFFCHSQLRSIPLAVNRSLINWANGKYPLLLLKKIPTPLQVLKIQAQGFRCVSVITDPEIFKSYILGERDVFSFIVHDLIHADHFFSKPDWRQAQIGFYRWVLAFYGNSKLIANLQANPQFKEDFEYVTSDMNSHPVHLVKTLKAHICKFDIPVEFISDRFQQAYENLNTANESLSDAEIIFNELKSTACTQQDKQDGVLFGQITAI